MSIRRRGKSWEIDYIDISGKRVRKSGFRTKVDAEIFLAEAKVNKSRGISNILDKNLTIEDACIYFLNNYAGLHCKEKTFDEYKIIVYKIIIPYFKGAKLANLKKTDIEDFVKTYKDKGLKNATVNKYKTVLGSIIERQIENGKIFQNVAKKVKPLKTQCNIARALNRAEIRILLDTCKKVKPDFYNMLFTLVHTGMRRGEIVALMWKNVDFSNNVINVRYSEYKGKLVTPKSATSYRSIKMPSVLRNVLLNQKLKTGDGKFVFPNALGGMYMANNVNRRMFKPVVRASNLGELRLHDIRHTYGSQLIENGAHIKYVQAQMGHASVNVTLNIYTHYYVESEDKALTILENLYTT